MFYRISERMAQWYTFLLHFLSFLWTLLWCLDLLTVLPHAFHMTCSLIYVHNIHYGRNERLIYQSNSMNTSQLWTYSDSGSDSEIIYSATYHTITIFTYIWFQYNGPRRPPLIQNYVAGMRVIQMRYLYVHVYIIFYIYMYIYIIIHNNIWLARNKYIT